MIEVELKKEAPLNDPKSFCSCGKPSTRTITVGRVENHYGTEYEICGKEECLEQAMDNEVEEIDYARRHRHELMAQDRWNLREGK